MPIRKPHRGATLLDALMTLAILGAAAPFAYSYVAETSVAMRQTAFANQMIDFGDVVKNYIALNQSIWPNDFDEEISANTFAETFADYGVITPHIDLGNPRVIIYKNKNGNAQTIRAYLIWPPAATLTAAKQAAAALGSAGGVAENDGTITSASGVWSDEVAGVETGSIVLRITENSLQENTEHFMHRVKVSGADNLNMMETDLNMSDGGRRYSVVNAMTLSGIAVDAANAETTLVKTQSLEANTALFTAGLRLDPDNAMFDTIRISGDIIGARKIITSGLYGGLSGGLSGLSQETFNTQGRIIADRTNIYESVDVAGDMEIKSATARSVSAWYEMSVNSLSAPYLYAMYLNVPNAGITISSDRITDMTNPSLRLGNWSFPNAGGAMPEFNFLKILSYSSDNIADILNAPKNKMEKLTGKGWIELKPGEE